MSTPAIATEPIKKEFSWKLLFIKAAGFGAGFALMLSVLAGVGIWYWNRPKAWNDKVITAKFSGSTLQIVGDNLEIRHTYALHNPMNTDYALPEKPTGELLMKAENSTDLNPEKDASWAGGTTIPAQQTVNVVFTLRFSLADYNTTSDKLEDIDKLLEFEGKRIKEIDSGEFYDYKSRYRIMLPPLPKPDFSKADKSKK